MLSMKGRQHTTIFIIDPKNWTVDQRQLHLCIQHGVVVCVLAVGSGLCFHADYAPFMEVVIISMKHPSLSFPRKRKSTNPGCRIESGMTKQEPAPTSRSHGAIVAKE